MSKKKTTLQFSDLLAGSVHDMKNSLGIILNAVDELFDQGIEKQHIDTSPLKKIRYEGKRLNNNFIELLTMYRIENKQYFANIDEHNVHDCLEEALLENSTVLQSKNINANIDCDTNFMWFFDRAMILGVINTILNNAYTYAKQEIRLSAKEENNNLVIKIDDDGNGYPQEMLNITGNKQREIDFVDGNTGLGLHFATLVAELHTNKDKTGSIKLSNSGINHGASFSIVLP